MRPHGFTTDSAVVATSTATITAEPAITCASGVFVACAACTGRARYTYAKAIAPAVSSSLTTTHQWCSTRHLVPRPSTRPVTSAPTLPGIITAVSQRCIRPYTAGLVIAAMLRTSIA